MAGDWIKFDCDLPEKPEVWELADRVDLDPDAVVGKLLRVWRWFDSHTEDGNAPTVTKRLLDREVGVAGFADAMCQVGWLDNGDDTISVPNFSRHNGKTAKTRALTAKRVAEHKKNANEKGNAEVTEGALPREEKRRDKPTTAHSGQRQEYPPEFERAWKAYPKRHGDNPKHRALKAWNARLREGHTAEEMEEGVQRYAQWCDATGKTGHETVKQAATFFGPDKAFLEDWNARPERQRRTVV